jgi:hypothetical protein
MAYLDNFQRVNNPFTGVNALWPSLNIQPKGVPMASGNSGPNMSTPNRGAFTPNQFTSAQLAGMGAAPQWMMDAYTNKIGKMGGNANLPPFAVTQSGFPGQAGKPGLPSAPTGTVGGTNG